MLNNLFKYYSINSRRFYHSEYLNVCISFDCDAYCMEGQVCCFLNNVAYLEHSCVIGLLVIPRMKCVRKN
jgi:hypothetical protein